MTAIGVLAIQGGYAAHAAALGDLGVSCVEVRYAEQLDAIDGLVLPGGESSTNILILKRFLMWEPLRSFGASGRPVLATCAGLILAAREVRDPSQESFGWIDVTVSRNAWGRQVWSFQDTADDGSTPLLFIRAPRITRIGPEVDVLATLRGEPILVREKNVLAATFHPELTRDRKVHGMFLDLCREQAAQSGLPAANAG